MSGKGPDEPSTSLSSEILSYYDAGELRSKTLLSGCKIFLFFGMLLVGGESSFLSFTLTEVMPKNLILRTLHILRVMWLRSGKRSGAYTVSLYNPRT